MIYLGRIKKKDMKKIVLFVAVLATTLVSIISCSTDENKTTIALAQELTLTSPASSVNYTLTAPNAGNVATTVKWTSANFGSSTVVKYTLQIIKSTTTSFNNPQVFDLGNFNENGTITTHEKAITQRQLNTLILNASGNIGVSESYKMRVVGSPDVQTGANSPVLKSVSSEISFTCNPFDTFDEFTRIYVPGSYGAASGFADWSGSGNSAKLFSANNNGIYEGFVWMNVSAPQFKFNLDPTWSGNDKGESNPTGAFTGILGTAENIKPSQGAGTYFFTVNWNTQTYTMNKQQVAIIGAATPNGWGTPTYLDFDVNPASPTYGSYTKVLALAADEFLIRLKDDWSAKFGSTLASTETLTSTIQNKIKFNGSNMKVPTAGNYKVVLSIGNSANYNLKLIPN